jgi:glycosyltransferase involved in cell wall biosynthesis
MISIIVPTFNGSRYLKGALDSIVHQNYPPSEYEILIVDNCSTDNTKEIGLRAIAAYHDHSIKYIFEPMPGLLSGRHRGVLEAQGEVLIFIDDDITADENWLQSIADIFEDESVQFVTGKNLPDYQSEPPDWLDWFWDRRDSVNTCGWLSLLDFGDEVKEIDHDYVWGLNFSVRKSALLELGGFHPDAYPNHLQIFQGDGETGLTMKAKEKGYKAIYQPKASVYHKIPATRMTYEYFENRYYFQGVCDSYADVRRNKGKWQSMETSWKGGGTIIPGIGKTPEHFPPERKWVECWIDEKRLKERFQQAYKSGYGFHRNAVRKSPKVLKWVLKDDYWDYKLPEIDLNIPKMEFMRSY